MKKRLLSILLAVCIVVGMLPAIMPTAQAAGTGVVDKLNGLREKYPEGAYWNHYVSQAGQDCDSLPDWDETYANSVTSTACAHHSDGYNGDYVGLYDCNRFDGGSQCWGFARKVFYDVFGVKCSSAIYNDDPANVQVGDYVRFGPDNGGHSFVVIERTGNMVKVVECNFGYDATNHCQIKWDRKFDITDTVYGLSFNYSYHAPNYDAINGSSIGPSQPDPTENPDFEIKNGYLVKYKGNGGDVVLPASVTIIGDNAFSGYTSLTSVSIPSSVTSIGQYAFEECTSLTSVSIPSSVTSIGQGTFLGCTSLTSVDIPSSVTSIGHSAFLGCTSLTSVSIPSGVTSIGDQVFANCRNLTSVSIPSGVTSIGYNAFLYCTSLTSVSIPSGVTSIGVSAFSSCYSLTSVNFPSSVTSIGDAAFCACYNLTSVSIPSGVTSIGNQAFWNCYRLTSVSIPASVTSIGNAAFGACDSLKDVYYGGSETRWNSISIESGNDGFWYATIHYNSTRPSSLKEILQQIVGDAKKVLGVASIRCPVDVEVYVGNQLVGRVIDNVVSDVAAEQVFIGVENDEKYVYFLTNEKYTLRLAATGEGTMEYMAQNLDVPSWTTLDGKYFKQVSLTPGKKMVSYIKYLDDELVDTPNVQLYVLDNAGEAEKVVLPDDKGTEVPINTPIITFDSGVSSISVPPVAVGTNGTLSKLPVPTHSGYAFDGWYMPDGTKVSIDTVFVENTTIKAQWTYIGTSTPNTPSIPNTPSVPSNPGGWYPGSYNPPAVTHTVSVPSVTGGTISVSSTSASSGSTVTVTATPDAGYELAILTVSDASGKTLELTDKGNGQYSFKMPNGKVLINAEFKPVSTDVPWNNPFMDVSIDNWYYDAVKFVNQNGLMNGGGNGLFEPDVHLSRAMLSEILYNKEGRPAVVGGSTFADVQVGAWYADAVAWASASGIVGGYGNGFFGPNDDITREQFAVILYRYAGSPVPPNLLLNFTDAYKISDWAQDAMRWAVDQGILNGKGNGNLDPTGKATRAEAAQMLKNYFAEEL